MPVMYTTEI